MCESGWEPHLQGARVLKFITGRMGKVRAHKWVSECWMSTEMKSFGNVPWQLGILV